MSRPKGTGQLQIEVLNFLREHPDMTVDEIIAQTGLRETQVKHVLDHSLITRTVTYSPLRGVTGRRTPVADRRWRIAEGPPSSTNGTMKASGRSTDLQAKIDQLKRYEQIRRDTFIRLMRQLEGAETQAGEEETP